MSFRGTNGHGNARSQSERPRKRSVAERTATEDRHDEGTATVITADPLIARLSCALDASNSMTRKNAAVALRLHGPRAVAAIPVLTCLLARETDPHVQTEVRRALRRLQRSAA